MVALAAVVGRKIAIRPKRQDDWLVVPNLWGATIGRSGVLLKSPLMHEATRPLRRLEIEAKKRFDAECREHDARDVVASVQKKEEEKRIRKALGAGQDAETLARELADRKEIAAPTRQRYILNDATVEKLGEILNENSNGVLCYRDEFIGFLRSLERDGNESARASNLEAWNGVGRFTYDRIGRGTIDIESTTVSILGGIQPTVLQEYIRWSLRKAGDDGFLQRFQLAVWPDVPKTWQNVDRWPDTKAKNTAFEVFQKFATLDVVAVDAEVDWDDPEGIPYVRFDDSVQGSFDQWHADLEHRLRSGQLHPAMEQHLAKYRSLVPSLALPIHLADGGSGALGVASLRKAMDWAKYLETHARRIYDAAINPGLAAAHALAVKLQDGAIVDGFAVRNVYRRRWSGLSSREDVVAGAEVLADLGWIRPVAVSAGDQGGRPTQRYLANPEIQKPPTKATAKTDRTASRWCFVGFVSTHMRV